MSPFIRHTGEWTPKLEVFSLFLHSLAPLFIFSYYLFLSQSLKVKVIEGSTHTTNRSDFIPRLKSD
jgi:hypothetical protein